jgi:hypothetical protein
MATKKLSEITNQVSDADIDAAKFLVTTERNVIIGQPPLISTGYALGSQFKGGIGGGGSYKAIKRFSVPYVGNSGATSGYMIDGADDNFDGIADSSGINGGIGHSTNARDGNMTTGLWIVAVTYPGNGSIWHSSNMGNGFNATAEKNFHTAMGNITLHNPGLTNSVCGNPAGTASTTTLNYKSGNGQSVCLKTGYNTSWIRFRGDGKVDVHLRTGNATYWSYLVVTCFQYQ